MAELGVEPRAVRAARYVVHADAPNEATPTGYNEDTCRAARLLLTALAEAVIRWTA
jgi:hypothetical protein